MYCSRSRAKRLTSSSTASRAPTDPPPACPTGRRLTPPPHCLLAYTSGRMRGDDVLWWTLSVTVTCLHVPSPRTYLPMCSDFPPPPTDCRRPLASADSRACGKGHAVSSLLHQRDRPSRGAVSSAQEDPE